MTSYYPSQGVPVAYSAGYGQPGYAGYGPSAGGVIPQAVPAVGPVVMTPSQHYYGSYNPNSIGNIFRRFFGFAPPNGVRYKSDRDTWGFMGYSRRQRYIDARTGGEVDRHGRPVYRI